MPFWLKDLSQVNGLNIEASLNHFSRVIPDGQCLGHFAQFLNCLWRLVVSGFGQEIHSSHSMDCPKHDWYCVELVVVDPCVHDGGIHRCRKLFCGDAVGAEINEHSVFGELLDPPDTHNHHVGDQAGRHRSGQLLVEAAVGGVVDVYIDVRVLLIELGEEGFFEKGLAAGPLKDRSEERDGTADGFLASVRSRSG